jgi:hypothetical protein
MRFEMRMDNQIIKDLLELSSLEDPDVVRDILNEFSLEECEEADQDPFKVLSSAGEADTTRERSAHLQLRT